MLWLQAIHFQNPLDVIQKAREENAKRVSTTNKRENSKQLWFLDDSWHNEGPLNEIEARAIGSDIFLVTNDKKCITKLFEERDKTLILLRNHLLLPKRAKKFLDEKSVVVFSDNNGGYVWIKRGQYDLFEKSIHIS